MLLKWMVAVLVVLSTALPARAQQVVFSRREYAAVGSTYQQIWMLDIATARIRQLTTSARDHNEPRCQPDGQILFSSGTPVRLWLFNSATGAEGQIVDALQLTPISLQPIPLVSGSTCEDPVKSPDAKRIACHAGADLVVVDSGSHAELERMPFAGQDSTGAPYGLVTPTAIRWSPDGVHVLFGIYGEASSSTASVSDYFVADLSTKTWKKVVSGNDAIWLADGKTILYTTQRDLTPLPAPASTHSVWTQHLMAFDVASGKRTALTSGVSNNLSPSLCR